MFNNMVKENFMKKFTRCFTGFKNIILMLFISLCLSACEIELYQGLTEKEANKILTTLLKNGIPSNKVSMGKNGFTIMVDESRMVQALEILNYHSLPSEQFQSLGTIFSGDSMIASATEENARMAYAISQELSDTISRIDGVLTSRVHVVLGVKDQASEVVTNPSASIFIRHTPESAIGHYIPQIREMVEKSVPDLSQPNISVTLMPVREEVSTPMALPPSFFEAFIITLEKSWQILGLLALTGLGAIVYFARLTYFAINRKKAEQSNSPEEDEA